eukprot:gene8423-8606_t
MDKAGGIVVDGNFKTSVHDTYAIGDVASFPLVRAGGALVRQEHVTHARLSAAHVTQVLLGAASTPYDYLPFFYSREFNLSWQFYGQMDEADQVVTWGVMDATAAVAATESGGAKFGAYWIKDGKVVGAFMEGASAEESAALKAVALTLTIAPLDLSELQQQGIAWAIRTAAAKL